MILIRRAYNGYCVELLKDDYREYKWGFFTNRQDLHTYLNKAFDGEDLCQETIAATKENVESISLETI